MRDPGPFHFGGLLKEKVMSRNYKFILIFFAVLVGSVTAEAKDCWVKVGGKCLKGQIKASRGRSPSKCVAGGVDYDDWYGASGCYGKKATRSQSWSRSDEKKKILPGDAAGEGDLVVEPAPAAKEAGNGS